MRQKLVIVGVVALAVGAVLALRPAPGAATSSAAVTTQRRLPRLVDLGAKTCVPCKAMVPVLDGLRADYAGKLDVEFIDLFEHREAGEQWRVTIMPTQVFLDGEGRELARHEGFISREDILARFEQLGVTLD